MVGQADARIHAIDFFMDELIDEEDTSTLARFATITKIAYSEDPIIITAPEESELNTPE